MLSDVYAVGVLPLLMAALNTSRDAAQAACNAVGRLLHADLPSDVAATVRQQLTQMQAASRLSHLLNPPTTTQQWIGHAPGNHRNELTRGSQSLSGI